MPIRPENRDRYPANWPAIAARIRARDGNCCKFCGVPNGELGGRDSAGRFMTALPQGWRLLRLEWPKPGEWAWCTDGRTTACLRIIRIVLTVAHLQDRDPAACDDDNLAALCQRCHLHHDRFQHAETRRAGRATGDLFAPTNSTPGGADLSAPTGREARAWTKGEREELRATFKRLADDEASIRDRGAPAT